MFLKIFIYKFYKNNVHKKINKFNLYYYLNDLIRKYNTFKIVIKLPIDNIQFLNFQNWNFRTYIRTESYLNFKKTNLMYLYLSNSFLTYDFTKVIELLKNVYCTIMIHFVRFQNKVKKWKPQLTFVGVKVY